MSVLNSRFPLTLWPATPLPPVPVQRAKVAVSDDGTLDWDWASGEPQELPPEWALRQLADVDLDDDAAIVGLLDQYGVITHPFYKRDIVPDRTRLARATGRLVHGWWDSRHDGTLEDARWWLRMARGLAAVWSEAVTDGDPLTAWPAAGLPAPGWESMSWALFTNALNVGLSPFFAHVEHVYRPPGSELEQLHGTPLINLYEGACAQLFNLMVSEQTARRCENVTCRRVFVHQLGTARHRQHRTVGVRFCTKACADLEAQRAHRRRKAAQRKKEQKE